MSLYGPAQKIETQDGIRKYRVAAPWFRRPKGMIIALHGLGHSGRVMAYYTGLHNIARRKRMLVVYPDGLDTKDYRRGWNAEFCCGSGWKHAHHDEEFLVELTKTVRKKYHVGKSVYVVGYSNGAMMTHLMAARHPDIVTAAVVVAGAVGTDSVAISPKKPVPMMLVHGTKDRIVTYGGGSSPGNDLLWQPFSKSVEVWQKANKNKAVVEIVEHPDGHRWPQWRIWKTWNRRPEFSRRVVSFFESYL